MILESQISRLLTRAGWRCASATTLKPTSSNGHDIKMRIGINSGPLVAGVVGTHKFSYDLWGDVVNVASRMESEGIPGSIQVTETTHELIRDAFVCEPRGVVSVKGKGDMSTFLLLSRNAGTITTA